MKMNERYRGRREGGIEGGEGREEKEGNMNERGRGRRQGGREGWIEGGREG